MLEEGLFDFNPQLAVIWLESNKISQIHPNIFDNLSKLTDLWFTSNTCINMSAQNTAEVKEFIKVMRVNCSGLDPATTTIWPMTTIDDLSTESSNMSDIYDDEFKLCNGSSLDMKSVNNQILEKIDNIEQQFGDSNAKVMEKVTRLEEKVEALQKSLKSSQESLDKFKNEVIIIFSEILNKLDQNSKTFKTYISQMEGNITQNFNDRLKRLEKSLSSSKHNISEQQQVNVEDAVNEQ